MAGVAKAAPPDPSGSMRSSASQIRTISGVCCLDGLAGIASLDRTFVFCALHECLAAYYPRVYR